MKRKLAIGAIAVALCLGVVVTRAVWEGRSALHRGDDAVAGGDLHGAVAWYRRAARWYVPLAPHVGNAYDRLEGIAEAAEQGGDLELALEAWRAVRGSILATRSVYTPQSGRLDPANQHIAALMARVEGPKADPGRSESERRDWHYGLLTRDDAPSVPWSIVALLGFAMWLGGGALFAARGVTAADSLAPRPAALAAGLVALGLVVWMLGLYNA